MASTKERMQEDLKTAMRAREQHLVTTLRCLLAAIKQIEVDKRIEADETVVASVLLQEQKKRRDALKYAEQQKRDDLIAQNQAEMVVLQKYLGEPLSLEELHKLVHEIVATGADNIGKVMAALNQNHKGRFDAKAASELCRNLFAAK